MSETEQTVIIATDGFCDWSVTQLLDRPFPQHCPQGWHCGFPEQRGREKCGNRVTGLGEGHLRST